MTEALASLPTRPAADTPVVTGKEMRKVDRLMVEDFGVQLIQMMENAGLTLAELARLHLDGRPIDRRVVVLAGQGNNGGGGLTAARRLSAWGAEVAVVLSVEPRELRDVPALQFGILQRMGVPVTRFDGTVPAHELLIDAIIGYSLRGVPRGLPLDMIAAANDSPAPTISLDVPSGVDVDSGSARGNAVRATATLTLALPKPGLLTPSSREFVGGLYLADISVPPGLYAQLGLSVPPLFERGPLLKVQTE